MELLAGRLLADLPHGFTTRSGGVSAAPFDALNLGGLVGDDPAAVAENWRRLEGATGLRFARVRQVHGDAVHVAATAGALAADADVVVSGTAGVAACVGVADCVPILLADAGGRWVAAVHAGWRGTEARAAAAGVRALVARGAQASQLRAVVGPAIGPCCYQVSADLAARFEEAFGAAVVRRGAGGPRLDLWGANAAVLAAEGVRAVEVLARCTACERERFFSHRRDAGRTGRMAAFVAPARADIGGRAVP